MLFLKGKKPMLPTGHNTPMRCWQEMNSNSLSNTMNTKLPPIYHVTHLNNLSGISECGILSHEQVPKKNLSHTDISNGSVQQKRDKVEPIFNRCLHDYVPTYFNPRNPFQYAQEPKMWDQLAILQISYDVFKKVDFVICDGNAASHTTCFSGKLKSIEKLPWDVLKDNRQYWPDKIDGRRKICAECLIYPSIKQKYIAKIHFRSLRYDREFSRFGFEIAHTPGLFF